MPKLIGTDGTRLFTFDLPPGSLTVGRSAERDICIPDKTVSRKHATVTVSPDGQRCAVTDTGSHNGTTVNGVRIAAETNLALGDRVMFGSVEFSVRDEGDSPQQESRPATVVLSTNEPEKSVFLSINEALRPVPTKVADHPELFPTLSEMARMLVVSDTRDVMLEKSLALVNKVIPAERLAILLTEEEGDGLQTETMLLPGGKDPGSFRLSQTIAKDILTNKNAILIGNPGEDPRFAQQQSIIMSDMSSAMAVPLFDEDQVLGILYVDTTSPLHKYTDDHLRLLATFANIIGSRMMNYTLMEERQEKQVIAAELKRAAKIQKNLLRRERPDVEGYTIDFVQEPCRAVGGDLYDAALLPDGRLVFLVADVSGKGIGAAILMSNILASFRILYNVKADMGLAEIVDHVSKQIFYFSDPADFATLFVGVVDPSTHVLKYINAGHNPAILVRAEGERELLEASGTMIGAFDLGGWMENTAEFAPGDSVVVFSDGVTEAECAQKDEMYGDARLESFLIEKRALSPEELVSSVMENVMSFTAGTPRSDDITVLVVKRTAGC